MEAVGMSAMCPDPAFWAGKRVLVTGHTGFKGAWLCLLLDHLGARVSGLALPAEPDGAYQAMRPPIESHIADIRDAGTVMDVVRRVRPDIVLHLAAQALVGVGHARPLETFATNVMGTAHLLAALSASPAAVALMVTTDKVYRPDPGGAAFHEDSPLGGTDPYSASKAAAEHVTAGWRERLRDGGCIAATARAGNVLGGGDVAAGRLAPDVIRAFRTDVPVMLRCPESVRPWQYVLDVLAGYLLYVQALARGEAPAAMNFGPGAADALTAAELTRRLQCALGSGRGWRQAEASFAETAALRLDPKRAWRTLGWRTTTGIEQALGWTAAWHQAAWAGQDMHRVGRGQIQAWLTS
jgi:CDP-glucose 4,6-dehydratase